MQLIESRRSSLSLPNPRHFGYNVPQRVVRRSVQRVVLTTLLLTAVSASAEERTSVVLATAYNSTHAQTDQRPNKGAWGDAIEPGMKIIAVSRDLIRRGLRHGTKVRIDELEGEWTVLDRTPSRYKNRIDIYLGVDIKAARQWGQRKVTIHWTAEP